MNFYTISASAWNTAFSNLWNNMVTAVPTFVVALVVFSLGLLVAGALGALAKKIIKVSKLDQAVEKAAAFMRLQTLGFTMHFASLVGLVVQWFLVIVTLVAVADILHLAQVNVFFSRVALYLPNVLVGVLLLGFGLVLARFIGQVVERGVKSSRLPSASAGALAMMAEWSVVIFAVMATLVQLGVASRMIEILFTGLVLGFSIAFGLAFGLGGKDQARAWLEKVSRDMGK